MKRILSKAKSPLFSHFSESQAGVDTIRAFKVEDLFINRMQSNIDMANTCRWSFEYAMMWNGFRLEIMGNLVTLAASLFAIFAKSSLSPGLVGLAITTSFTFSGIFHYMAHALSEFEVKMTSFERIKEYFDLTSEAEWSIEDTKPSADWPQAGQIAFKNYSFKYREDLKYVVKDISCDIKPGEKIGIVGRTGAGKSSLTSGLFRMLETSKGQIFIDGVDIGTIGLHDLRQKLTIIPQDPIIFSGSIKMNLDPFDVHDDAAIWEALELANLKSFVSSLENKLLFVCSEGGSNLRY